MKNGLDLGNAYEATLGRIRVQGGEKTRLGMATLMWISHSGRPLQADEICYALAVRIGSNDLNIDDIPAVSTLLSCCQGLVTVDKGTWTVRLIHFTLQEYLRRHPDLFGGAHTTMAEICLTYLNFQCIKDLSACPPPYPPEKYRSLNILPYIGESICEWSSWIAQKHLHSSFSVSSRITYLLNSFGSRLPFYYRLGNKPFSALHCISYFGIADLTNTLIKMNRWDVNQNDDAGMTPPIWAAGNGHEGVVRLFLGPRFVDPGSIGRRLGKVSQVVGLLVGTKYVNPDSLGKFSRTPWCFRE